MFGAETQAESLQAIDLPRLRLVRTADGVPELKEQRGDPAHPAAGDADEMNSMPLARQHLLEIQVRGERHDSIAYIFPSFRPRARPRFSAPNARKLPRNAEADPDSRSAREFSPRAIRPSGRILLAAAPRPRERKSRRSSSGGLPPRKERE